jgi:hypothetical protein
MIESAFPSCYLVTSVPASRDAPCHETNPGTESQMRIDSVIVVLGNCLVLLERLGLTLGAAQALNLHQYFCLLFSILLLRELLRSSSSVILLLRRLLFFSFTPLELFQSAYRGSTTKGTRAPVFRLRDPRIWYSKPTNLNPVISKPRTSR